MTTVVNNPSPQPTDSGGNTILVGIIIFMGLVMVVLFFGVPAFRRMESSSLSIPAPQINVPSKIDVNISQPK